MIIFNVSCACFTSLHHRTEGNISSHVLRPEKVLFLNVCIEHSAAFTQRLCVSTNCIMMLSYYRYFWTNLEAKLLMMLKTGLKPLFVKYGMFSLKLTIVYSYFKYLTDVARIALDEQSYIANMAVLLSIELIVNFC